MNIIKIEINRGFRKYNVYVNDKFRIASNNPLDLKNALKRIGIHKLDLRKVGVFYYEI